MQETDGFVLNSWNIHGAEAGFWRCSHHFVFRLERMWQLKGVFSPLGLMWICPVFMKLW